MTHHLSLRARGAEMSEMTGLRYAYYPGCSLSSGEKEYGISVRAVFAHMGIELVEIEDWSCCGAVHAGVNSETSTTVLPARNLALAAAQGFDTIIVPCSGCYLNLRRASKRVAGDKAVRAMVKEHLREDLAYETDVEVLHPLYALMRDVGLDAIRALVTHPLSSWQIASYYGCMMTRPKDVFDSAERPVGLDQLAATLGATPVDYPMKAKCCGGALALSHSGVTARLTGDVLVSAQAAGADVTMLACPMCHTALDTYQRKAARAVKQPIDMPVLFFTQAMGLAFGLDPDTLGLKRHLVSPERALAVAGF